MNRNAESHFAQIPRAEIPRSRFDRSHDLVTTVNTGRVVPIFVDEVLPNDTFDLTSSKVIRLMTPIAPIFGDLYADFYFFFVPARLCWKNWKYFMGEAKDSPWLDETIYTPPTVTAPNGGWVTGTIAEYMGVPIGVNKEVNALPFRAYAKIIDDWFRDENLQTPVSIDDGDTDIIGSNGDNYITDLVKGGKPFIAAKAHDYLTSCLPEPQKGPDVPIPLGDITVDGTSSVFGTGKPIGFFDTTDVSGGSLSVGKTGKDSNGVFNFFSTTGTQNDLGATVGNVAGMGTGKFVGVPTKEMLDELGWTNYRNTTGLEAVFDDSQVHISAATINELRIAFSMQKFYERLATSGSRYIEILRSMFGAISPDARLQRSEYLGGNRVPISISQVVQTSATQAETGLVTTPQGTVGAYSLTNDRNKDFVKSFSEHGFVIGVMVIRYQHVYQQSLDRMFTRKDRFDYYWPVFSHIGNQPVYNYEIYCQGDDVINDDTGKPYDDETFGFQEAWASYRYKQNMVTGQMRSAATGSLDVWHLADDYDSLPHLGSSWIHEDIANVDRTLTVQSSVADQFKVNIHFRNLVTRAMPLYSVPGLIDHF